MGPVTDEGLTTPIGSPPPYVTEVPFNSLRENENKSETLLLQFSRCETQPLMVAVEVVDYPGTCFHSLIDNGAEVNLIKESAFSLLDGIQRYPSGVARSTVVGNARIPINEYVILRLRLEMGYISTLEEFYILPDSAMDNSMVIGLTLLRANSLLPDMSTHQHFHRTGNDFKVISKDLTIPASIPQEKVEVEVVTGMVNSEEPFRIAIKDQDNVEDNSLSRAPVKTLPEDHDDQLEVVTIDQVQPSDFIPEGYTVH